MTITLKDLPLELEELIRRRAEEEGQSLDRTVVQLLEEAAGRRAAPTQHSVTDDLDALAGTWSAEEAAEFDAILAEQRQIDPDLWR